MNKTYEIGLVIGKFYPLHYGHQHLINFAKNKVKKLYILICGKYEEEPNPILRENWINEIYNDKNIKVIRIIDLFDPNDSELWAKVTLNAICCKPDIVFTSENYGIKYANFLNCKHELVDIERKNVPISGTLIRNNPFKYWDYLSPNIRQFYTFRIIFVGAESTGKTTLSSNLANELNIKWVHEYGRDYEKYKNNLIWNENDFNNIQLYQNNIENKAAENNKIIICDTDCITTSVWYERYLQKEINFFNTNKKESHTIYLLSDFNNTELIDDGTRSNSNNQIRSWMHNKILDKLNKNKSNFIILSGSYDNKYEKAKDIIIKYINNINNENIEINIKNKKPLFTIYEYIFMIIFSIFSIIFSFININPGEQLYFIDFSNVTWQSIIFLLSGICSFSGVLSVVLASKEYIYTYIFGIINCITFGLYSFAYGYVGNFQLNIIYFLPLQFYGLHIWQSNIKVKSLTKLQIVGFTYLSFILTLIFYFEIPSFTIFISKQEYLFKDNLIPRILDSLTTSLSIIAQYLLINKYFESWFIWIIIDILQIIMFSGINNFISINILIMMCFYLCNAFYGLYLWKYNKNYI